eukprot:symbB.v1.2.025495.t1/scaffold2479.1/size78191/1
MGSFVAPSAQGQGFAFPLEVVEDARLLRRLMGRCPDVLALYVTTDDEVTRAWRLVEQLMDRSTVCFLGPDTLQLPGGEVAPYPWPINALQCLTTLAAAPDQGTKISWSRLDISNTLGRHFFSASVAVANVVAPKTPEIWLEVGCNNWDMLRDQLPLDGSVWLLTLEPLVDKFAFLRAHQDPRQMVLPFAVAERDFGPFAALRSQNYSNFLGREGVTFQESGASSLLPYAEGFLDHRWEGSQAQYQNFREYMVPTVSLEWVVGTLLGKKSIEFLKIDAQGLDFGVFKSLGPFVDRVQRVQMELHEHVRHEGEIPCSEVLHHMDKVYGFKVKSGGPCPVLDSTKHDEAQKHRLILQMTEGVMFLHGQRPPFVHRDLKSANVVLDAELNAKLCDLGITERMERTHISKRDAEAGSPRYMSPELFHAPGKLTEKMDIWALGCLAIEVLTSRVPHEQCINVQQVATKLLVTKEPPFLEDWLLHFHPEVKQVLWSCLEWNPEDRPSAAKIFEARVECDSDTGCCWE